MIDPGTTLRRRSALVALLGLGLGLGPSACVNEDRTLYEVNLSGTITVADDAPSAGRVHVEVLHETSGIGTLAYPLRRITEFEVEAIGEFEETVLVPMEDGEGLVIYAWLDRDGDGVLCSPGVNSELAGIIELEEFPAHAIEVELTLTEPCAGAEILYP